MATGRRPLIDPEAPAAAAPSEQALRWSLEMTAHGAVVDFTGEIDENADFTELRHRLAGDVEFRLAGVTRINSCGVREWVNFVRELPSVTSLGFSHCSAAIVTQLNTIYNFRGMARIRSLMAPYVCASCGFEEQRLVEVDERDPEAARVVPNLACTRCGGTSEFDELPERYLSFLKEL